MSKSQSVTKMRENFAGLQTELANALADVKRLSADHKTLMAQLADRTKDEIQALIEKYGDPNYKTNEFALYDVISVAQQLRDALADTLTELRAKGMLAESYAEGIDQCQAQLDKSAQVIIEMRDKNDSLSAQLAESKNQLSTARKTAIITMEDLRKELAESKEEIASLQAEKGMADMGFVSDGASNEIVKLKEALEMIMEREKAAGNTNFGEGSSYWIAQQALTPLRQRRISK